MAHCQQECIPVGCILPAAVAFTLGSRVYPTPGYPTPPIPNQPKIPYPTEYSVSPRYPTPRYLTPLRKDQTLGEQTEAGENSTFPLQSVKITNLPSDVLPSHRELQTLGLVTTNNPSTPQTNSHGNLLRRLFYFSLFDMLYTEYFLAFICCTFK